MWLGNFNDPRSHERIKFTLVDRMRWHWQTIYLSTPHPTSFHCSPPNRYASFFMSPKEPMILDSSHFYQVTHIKYEISASSWLSIFWKWTDISCFSEIPSLGTNLKKGVGVNITKNTFFKLCQSSNPPGSKKICPHISVSYSSSYTQQHPPTTQPQPPLLPRIFTRSSSLDLALAYFLGALTCWTIMGLADSQQLRRSSYPVDT